MTVATLIKKLQTLPSDTKIGSLYTDGWCNEIKSVEKIHYNKKLKYVEISCTENSETIAKI